MNIKLEMVVYEWIINASASPDISTNNTAHLDHVRASQVSEFSDREVLFIELLTGCT
jgi:hypothetical protein